MAVKMERFFIIVIDSILNLVMIGDRYEDNVKVNEAWFIRSYIEIL